MTSPDQYLAMESGQPSAKSIFSELFPIIVNRLSFRTNAHTIVPFLLSQKARDHHRPGFSLNALMECPGHLIVPQTPLVLDLSLNNAALPILDESVRRDVVACLAPHYRGKLSPQELTIAIAQARQELDQGRGGEMEHDTLRRCLDSHGSLGYFSRIDWCLDHWGCGEDIVGMVEETFSVPTPQLEFSTRATPPILALQRLANTFPSVLFTLHYAAENSATWTEVQFHPFPPFGY